MPARQHRRVDPTNPQSGFYLISVTAKGWRVPTQIIRDGDFVSVVVNGQQVIDRLSVDVLADEFIEATIEGRAFDHPLFRTIMFGEQCDEATYNHRMAMVDWAKQHAPDHPCLHPERPIDVRTMPATEF